MASVIFQQTVVGQVVRVVDAGTGTNPRLTVEIQLPADAMGGQGWNRLDPITVKMFEAILIAAGVIT